MSGTLKGWLNVPMDNDSEPSSVSQFPSKPSRRAVDAAALRRAASERVRPGQGGLYSESAWRQKQAIGRAGMPALDRGTYLPAGGELGLDCLLEVVPDGLRLRYPGVPGVQRGGGLRGEVCGTSDASRRRLMMTLASLRPQGPVYFVTLTYADDTVASCGADSAVLAVKMERDRDAFLKRLARRWPAASALWKVEYQDRKSGAFVGVLVPHAHLIIFGMDGAALTVPDGYANLWRDAGKSANALLLQGWVKAAWADVVGAGSPEHERRGADVVELDSRRHGYSYIAKYTAKGAALPFRTGRTWGVFNRDALPVGPVVQLPVTEAEAVQLKRLLKRWLKGRGKSGQRYGRRLVTMPRGYGFWVFGFGLDALGGAAGVMTGGDDAAALRVLEKLAQLLYDVAIASVRVDAGGRNRPRGGS